MMKKIVALVVIFTNIFISCKSHVSVNKNTYNDSIFDTFELYTIVNPYILESMLQDCKNNYEKFGGEELSYVKYSRVENKIIMQIGSYMELTSIDYYPKLTRPAVACLDKIIIFISKLSNDDKLFVPQNKDTFLYCGNTDIKIIYCYFDTLYNFQKAEKFEPISVD